MKCIITSAKEFFGEDKEEYDDDEEEDKVQNAPNINKVQKSDKDNESIIKKSGILKSNKNLAKSPIEQIKPNKNVKFGEETKKESIEEIYEEPEPKKMSLFKQRMLNK